ncbi:Maf family protein [Aliishimia ponticola]
MILASASQIRSDLLHRARIEHEIRVARIDEDSVKKSLLAEEISPRDIADALAEAKARKVSEAAPDQLVLGCDQVLDLSGKLLSKPTDPDDCIAQLKLLRKQRHKLHSAAVICEAGRPIWRHIGTATLQMRDLSDAYIEDYVARNWDSIQHSVGGYKLEEEGVRLFFSVHGDFFHVLGLPLLELISYLVARNDVGV